MVAGSGRTAARRTPCPWPVGRSFFRSCLRNVPSAVRSGRLISVLDPAADVLGRGGGDPQAVVQSRVLIDALASEI